MPHLPAAINIHINPDLISSPITLTWHGFFTAVAIAAAVWLCLRLARQTVISDDDVLNIALVAVPAGIVGARTLWVLEHTDQIRDAGDLFALTDGGISVYGGLIGGVVGAMIYIMLFRPGFPRWVGLDVAAPGMILAQGIGRFGDFINGEHFARATDLPWGFRYTHPRTDGPWASFIDGEYVEPWFRGQSGRIAEQPVPVHPVAGVYEPILDFLILGLLLVLWRRGARPGWMFVTYMFLYAAVRGLLALLRADEQSVLSSGLSVPQLIAIVTGLVAGALAYYLYRRPQAPRAAPGAEPPSPPPAHGRTARVRVRPTRYRP